MASTPLAGAAATSGTSVDSKALSIDTLIAKLSKGLKPGQSISIPLYKGPICTTKSVDVITASRVSRMAAANNNSKASAQALEAAKNAVKQTERTFPRMAKFIETVTKPDFQNEFQNGHMFEEVIPKVKDDDEEDDDSDSGTVTNDTNSNPNNPNSNDPNNPSTAASNNGTNNPQPRPAARPKKKRWKRNQPVKRHWMILTNQELKQKITLKKMASLQQQQKMKHPNAPANQNLADSIARLEYQLTKAQSNRYTGLNESNTSHYVLMSPATANTNTTNGGGNACIHVAPLHGFTSFTQPAKYHTLSMTDAEQAIQKQRKIQQQQLNMGVRSRLFQKQDSIAASGDGDGSGADGDGVEDVTTQGGGDMTKKRKRGNAKKAAEDVDDVMVDLSFTGNGSGRAGSGGNYYAASKARREILSSLGDGDLTVDQDGILGGANDAEFGGKRRFGRLNVGKNSQDNGDDDDDTGGKKGGGKQGGGGGNGGAGNDGLAMEEDFYQRDVGAEYEEMDYDVNEQFDDDDLDIGAEEIDENLESTGVGVDDDDDDFQTDNEDDDDDDQAQVWKHMMKGDDTTNIESAVAGTIKATEAVGPIPTESSPDRKTKSPVQSDTSDNESTSLNTAAKPSMSPTIANKVEKKPKTAVFTSTTSAPDTTGKNVNAVDENGDRIITKEAVRAELWLHNGRMSFKKLKKNFNAKSEDRKKKFVNILQELCTKNKDHEGVVMILKQHYAKR